MCSNYAKFVFYLLRFYNSIGNIDMKNNTFINSCEPWNTDFFNIRKGEDI